MFRSYKWIYLLISVILIAGCSTISANGNKDPGTVYLDELNAKLTDPRLLRKLGVEEVVLLEVERFWVTIAETGTVEPIGELYYTIQDGWHLKADNETFEFVPGEGWIIGEQ